VSKYVDQINVRVPPDLKLELIEVADYEHIKVTDLVRELIRKKVQEVTATRAFQNWKRRAHEEEKEEGEA